MWEKPQKTLLTPASKFPCEPKQNDLEKVTNTASFGYEPVGPHAMAASTPDQLALFNQYDSEYCSKATDVARKIQAVAALGTGDPVLKSQRTFQE